jgi:hypothetical protein
MNTNQPRDYFEHFLKEATQNFKLQPKTCTWFSIYNNVHPQKKSPSLIIFIFFIAAFLKMGMLNTNELKTFHRNQSNVIVKSNEDLIEKVENTDILNKIVSNNNILLQADNKIIESGEMNKIVKNNLSDYDSIKLTDYSILTLNSNASTIITNNDQMLLKSKIFSLDSFEINTVQKTNTKLILEEESPFSFQIYATPSIGLNLNRQQNSLIKSSLNNELENMISNESKNLLSKVTSLDIEAGGSVIMNINKFMRLKAGMQLNYSRYHYQNINDGDIIKLANQASSSVNKSNLEQPNIQLSNKNTYLISMPVGTEFEIVGNRKIKWFVGATIQPGIILNDDKNDFKENSTESKYQNGITNNYKKWNCNTSIETFISYKLNSGIILNMGPQFRYRLGSNFDETYLLNGRIFNLGIKLGVTRSF